MRPKCVSRVPPVYCHAHCNLHQLLYVQDDSSSVQDDSSSAPICHAQKLEPSDQDTEARQELLAAFNEFILKKFPNPSTIKAIAFGSSISATDSPNSDADLALEGTILGSQLEPLGFSVLHPNTLIPVVSL